MINLPRYQAKGILLSYLLNQDVSEIIIHYLRIAEQASEVTFRESNQKLFRREYDWDIPMRQYMDQQTMNYVRINVYHYGYYYWMAYTPSYPDWAVSRRVREAVTDTCRNLRDQVKITKKRQAVPSWKLAEKERIAKKQKLTQQIKIKETLTQQIKIKYEMRIGSKNSCDQEPRSSHKVRKRNNRNEIARANRVMKKHMKNR